MKHLIILLLLILIASTQALSFQIPDPFGATKVYISSSQKYPWVDIPVEVKSPTRVIAYLYNNDPRCKDPNYGGTGELGFLSIKSPMRQLHPYQVIRLFDYTYINSDPLRGNISYVSLIDVDVNYTIYFGTAYATPCGPDYPIYNPGPNVGAITWDYGIYNLPSTYNGYQQTDYSDYRYDHTNVYISNLGCYLCSCCNALVKLGVRSPYGFSPTPPDVNTWLTNNKGYAPGGLVNPGSIVAYVKKVWKRTLKYVRNVDVNEALQRGYAVQIRVKSPSGRSHWVTIDRYLIDTTGALKYRMFDPMWRVRHWDSPDDYPEMYLNDNRCFYEIAVPPGGSSALSSNSAATLSGSESLPPSTKPGAIAVSVVGEIEASLWKDSVQKAEGSTDYLADDLDDAAPEIVSTQLYADECEDGAYELRLQGQPNAPYSASYLNYDDQMRTIENDWVTVTGVLDGNGQTTIAINHQGTLYYQNFSAVNNVSDGRRVELVNGVPTVNSQGGFYAQPKPDTSAERTPILFIAYSSSAILGRPFTLVGIAKSENGKKYIQAEELTYASSVTNYFPKPVGIPSERLDQSMHIYATTYGRVTAVTSQTITLNGSLTVKWTGYSSIPSPPQIGNWIKLDGAWDNGVFYWSNSQSLVVYSHL